MGKLHEVLAVEADLKSAAQSAIAKTKALFKDGQARLVGQIRVYRPLTENGEPQPEERTQLATTVGRDLEQLRDPFLGWLDAAIQKEVTNQHTSSSIEIDGKDLSGPLPAPALLNLEGKLAELLAIVSEIPTNDPSESWTWDAALGHYVSAERITYRTKKTLQAFVKYEATKEHPAQVESYTEDVRVGTWTTLIHSGMWTPARKKLIIERTQRLSHAIKKARQRANDVDVVDVNVGKVLWDYIFRE